MHNIVFHLMYTHLNMISRISIIIQVKFIILLNKKKYNNEVSTKINHI